jgi:phosphate starvation-inducible PhoH-like protein
MLKNIHKRLFSSNHNIYQNLLNDQNKKLIIAIGPAGTGKTKLACESAISSLKNNIIKKIIITRPLVCADKDIGYLPGKLEEKMSPWTRPILDVFSEHYTKSKIQHMIDNDIIEISPLAYMRGRTFKNSFVIGDELQNSNINQMKMLLTRLGDNSRIVINGDINQKDINEFSGLEHFIKLIQSKGIDDKIGLVVMNNDDVKRSELTKIVMEYYS